MINKDIKIPLYIQIYNDLKEKILNNQYKSEEFLPSERELSELYGVERATTRRALELLVKDKLLQKIPGVGTRVSSFSSTENSNMEFNSVAFILPGDTTDKITQPFVAEVFYYLEKECKKANYSLFYTNLKSDEDLPDFVLKRNVMGIVWISRVEDAFILKSKKLGIPSVLISNHVPGFTSILMDNIGGSCEAVEYLIGLGHRNIAFINGPSDYLNAKERLEGYKKALAKYGIDLDENSIMEADWTFEGGYAAMKKILENSRKNTAVFASNDMMALGAMKAIQEAGLVVPDDISVVGFDNIEQCAYSNPSLTTVGIDTSLVARHTMKCLLDLVEEPDAPAIKVIIPAKLLIRDSTR